MASLEEALEKVGLQMIMRYTNNMQQNRSPYFIVACNKANPLTKHPDRVLTKSLGTKAVFNLLEAEDPRNRDNPNNLNNLFSALQSSNYTAKKFGLRIDNEGKKIYKEVH